MAVPRSASTNRESAAAEERVMSLVNMLNEAKSGGSVLSQLKVETLLTLSGRVETQLSRETTGLTVAVGGGGQSEQLAQHSIRFQ